EIAARAHVDVIDAVIARALADAGCTVADCDAVAGTAGPGLIGGVLVGLVSAKALAIAGGKPFIGVNHLEGHALTVGLTDGVRPPYLLLLVSGGHTQTLIVREVGAYTRLGTTVDDALGEAFDKTAKLLGLGYPGGPAVAKAASDGDATRFSLPRPMAGRAEPHFSFAGLKTAVRQQAEALVPLSRQDIADVCASFELAVADAVEDRVRRAMQLYEDALPDAARTLVVAGGVAANVRLRTRLTSATRACGYRCVVAPPELCTDNAAMIAWAGAERFARGDRHDLDFVAQARWPLDPSADAAIGAGVKA
ncbi:MAG: tRNA (adenosine(37)-N6)-threonylcarbamoyltransferase complex transferase subunit TsaD, partial [Pseudomonadota bacterium]